MMAFVGAVIFAGALAFSCAVLFVTVGPQWRRMLRLAAGHVEPGFAPLATLATAERRIAVRRWAAQPVPATLHRIRAAA